MGVRICLVDGQNLVREGLCALIGAHEGFEVIAQAASCSDAVSTMMRTAPDLIIIEYILPDGCGLDVIRAVAWKMPAMRILVMTQGDCRHAWVESMRVGAHGFMRKEKGAHDLFDAMHAVMRGDLWFERLPDRMPAAAASECLTSRERSVVCLMARGGSNEDIAEGLRISVSTVKTHVYNVMQKLDAKNRAEAVHKARSIGVIDWA